MTDPDRDVARRAGRRLSLVGLALVAAGATLAGAARLAWFTAGVEAVGRGPVVVTATGADLLPALDSVALFALGAFAAAVALAGPARRVVGGLVALAGVVVGVLVGRVLVHMPTAADLAALPGAPAGGTGVAGSVALRAGPLVAAVGVLLLVAAAVALLVGESRLPRLGARYAAGPAAAEATADPDRAAWDALDAGRDPTTPGSPSTPPGRTDGGSADRAV